MFGERTVRRDDVGERAFDEMVVAESDVDVQTVEPSVGRAAVGEIFDDGNGLQPRKLIGEQPQHVRCVKIAKRSATEEEVHLRRVRGLSQIENDRPATSTTESPAS